MAALKPYSDIAYDYMEWFSNILKENKYTLHIESTVDRDSNFAGYHFTIKYPEINKEVGTIQTYLHLNSYYTRLLRSEEHIPANIISISSISINKEFQNLGIATKLLLAALCYTYVNVPDIYTHVILDDLTDSNILSMDKNIYNRLGFVPIGLVALSRSMKEMIPINAYNEKMYAKMQTIDHIFKAIIPIKKIPIKKKGGKHSKKRRHTIRRKHKKRRNTRNTRKT